VAEVGQRIIGFVDFVLEVDAATSRVQMTTRHFYVMPENRGAGVAGRLYREGMMIGKERGAASVVFAADDNERPFWERHGYEKVQNVMRKAI
jgi:predicted N-acetyltransferase YhbS